MKKEFQSAAALMNPLSLRQLWTVATGISALDTFSGEQPGGPSQLSTSLSGIKTQLFCDAILHSQASMEQRKQLNFDTYRQINNHLISCLTPDYEGPAGLAQALFATGNMQSKFNDAKDVTLHFTRAYLLYIAIPQTFRQEILASLKKDGIFVDVDEVLQEKFELAVLDFLSTGMRVFSFYIMALKHLTDIEGVKKEFKGKENNIYFFMDFLKFYLGQIESKGNFLIFNADLMKRYMGGSYIQKVIRLIARNPSDLRQMLQERPFNTSKGGYQFSPLERHPVVQIGDDEYLVPNLRLFVLAMAQMPHVLLMDEAKTHFENYRITAGFVQEIYLREFTKNSHPHIDIHGEPTYKKKQGQVQGFDLTLIDRRDGNLVYVESKAMMIPALAKISSSPEDFLTNIKRTVLPALNLAKTKHQDITEGRSGLEALHAAHLKSTSKPVVVVITRETYPGLMERMLSSEDPDFEFLRTFPLPFLVISLEEYEQLALMSAQNEISLHALLLSECHQYLQPTDTDPIQVSRRDLGFSYVDTWLHHHHTTLMEKIHNHREES